MISLRSQITRKVLNYFFINPKEGLYANELSRKLKVDKRNLVKKIKELELEGILMCQNRGNLKLYSANENYPLYEEYRRIILKTTGFEANIKKMLRGIKGITQAYIYGSYAKNIMDVHSDVDMLAVGTHSIILLQKKINKLQKDINREINVINMDEAEFKKRVKNKDPFIRRILEDEHIKVI